MSDARLPTPPASPAEYSPPQQQADIPPAKDALRFERKMGDTELSYFLPSRQTGVNDMYLHLGFHAPAGLARRARVRAVWGLLRLRHPLLAARAHMHAYDDVRFVYDPPASPDDVLADADASLEFRAQGKDELVDAYLNGPRTLSNDRLSYLVLSEPADTALPSPPRTPSPSRAAGPSAPAGDLRQYDLLLCAMHFLGDGMALHACANDFFALLGSSQTDAELMGTLAEEWSSRWGGPSPTADVLPPALEEHMPLPQGRFRAAAAQVDFALAQQKLVGGQAFPRAKHPERRTAVPTRAFPADRTRAMLTACKAHGVSISAALFALCNVAWARTRAGERAAPALMYSALNLRPYFTTKRPAPWDSYWFLAIGYFNVVLPGFLPADGALRNVFWHRAREAKAQSAAAAKSPLVASRTHEMARRRGAQARAWAREDDERERGTWAPPAPAAAEPRESVLPARAKAPSAALIGLSLLGNLDAVYKHAAFAPIALHTLTTGSRQRHGAMLLFGYTFAGRLWVSLGYDRNGFEGDVVDRFWDELLRGIDEFLVDEA